MSTPVVIMIARVEKFFHLIKLFPSSQYHISLLGSEGKIDTGLIVIVPGSVTVVEVKGNNHTVPLCHGDGEEHSLPRRRMGERCARDEQQLVAGDIALVQLSTVDVKVGAVGAVHETVARALFDLTHGHTGTDAGGGCLDVGGIHPWSARYLTMKRPNWSSDTFPM